MTDSDQPGSPAARWTRPDLVLIGCVKTKRPARSPARDLYDSPLWRCRRAYAESLACPWYILSALHGLLEPDRCIDPYELALTDLRVAARRAWSARVLEDLAARAPSIRGKSIEIHAGATYAEFGLEKGLRDLGATVRRPLAKTPGIGSQLAWYQARESRSSPDRTGVHADRPARSGAGRAAQLIADDFYENRLDLASRNMPRSRPWLEMPEVDAVRRLRASADERARGRSTSLPAGSGDLESTLPDGSPDRKMRRFLTFVAALDRARDAGQLWSAAADLHEAHPEYFDPEHVAGLDLDSLRDALQTAKVSRRHRPDSEAWQQIARSLSSGIESPVAGVIDAGRGDARELLRDLKSRDAHGNNRFPMLRGPKIGPMWLRMMAHPGRARMTRVESIPVAVDVQVRRATENLGVAATRGLPLAKAKPPIQRAWRDAAAEMAFGGPAGIAGTCAALDPALWFFGKHGCGHCEKVSQRVAFGRACGSCTLFR